MRHVGYVYEEGASQVVFRDCSFDADAEMERVLDRPWHCGGCDGLRTEKG